MSTPPPTSAAPPPPRRSRFRKRYVAAAAALAFSLVLTERGSVCVPVAEDGTQLCLSAQLLRPAKLATLPTCTPELANSNALDGSGDEVVCLPPLGWRRPDGGEL